MPVVTGRRLLPVLFGGQLFMLLACLAYMVWQTQNGPNEALRSKEAWLFPFYWQIMPLVLIVAAIPVTALLMSLARRRIIVSFLLTLPIGCLLAVASSILGRILEGRSWILEGDNWTQQLEKCLFLFIYSVDRLAGWQFLAICLAGALAISQLQARLDSRPGRDR